MHKNLVVIVFTIFLTGCVSIPSTEELDEDINTLSNEIKEVTTTVESYSGGALYLLAKVRLETLESTKVMLEQKKKGLNRFISISYSIDGKKYVPPPNKDELLHDLENDLSELNTSLIEAELESTKYGSGLSGMLSLTEAATLRNSKVLLQQQIYLLKHDIPSYAIYSNDETYEQSDFQPTPGEDIDKF